MGVGHGACAKLWCGGLDGGGVVVEGGEAGGVAEGEATEGGKGLEKRGGVRPGGDAGDERETCKAVKDLAGEEDFGAALGDLLAPVVRVAADEVRDFCLDAFEGEGRGVACAEAVGKPGGDEEREVAFGAFLGEAGVGAIAFEVGEGDAFGADFEVERGGFGKCVEDGGALVVEVGFFVVGEGVVVEDGVVEEARDERGAVRAVAGFGCVGAGGIGEGVEPGFESGGGEEIFGEAAEGDLAVAAFERGEGEAEECVAGAGEGFAVAGFEGEARGVGGEGGELAEAGGLGCDDQGPAGVVRKPIGKPFAVAAHEDVVAGARAVGREERLLEEGAEGGAAFLGDEGFGFVAKAREARAFGCAA